MIFYLCQKKLVFHNCLRFFSNIRICLLMLSKTIKTQKLHKMMVWVYSYALNI